MKLASCLFALVIAAAALLPLHEAQAQAQAQQPPTDRNQFCLSAATALLKQHVVKSDNKVTIQCFCSVSEDQIKVFMTWCVDKAKDQELPPLQNVIDHSPCTKPENLKNCVPQQ